MKKKRLLNATTPTRRAYSSTILPLILVFFLMSSCEKNFLQESSSSTDGAKYSARLSSEPLFSVSYEIEEFSAGQIMSKITENSKEKPFLEIASQPRLYRQKVEFKLFEDGNYEMVMTQLEPTKLDLLPPSLQKERQESVLSYKTIVQNGVAHFYNKNGNETGKSQLKLTRFNTLAEKILTSAEINKGQITSEVMGHPLINETYILGFAKDKNAQVKVDNGITEIKFDLSGFVDESNETAENLSKYSVQYYDFKNKRMLGEKLFDKNGDKMLYRSNLFYSPVDSGNYIERIISESFEEDPKTGVKMRQMKQTFYSNVKTDLNI